MGAQHPSSKPLVQPTGPSEYSSELDGRHVQELFDKRQLPEATRYPNIYRTTCASARAVCNPWARSVSNSAFEFDAGPRTTPVVLVVSLTSLFNSTKRMHASTDYYLSTRIWVLVKSSSLVQTALG